MKIAFVAALIVLCAASQAHGFEINKAWILENKSLIEDIDLAKSTLTSLASTARIVGSQEIQILQYLIDYGQYDANILYGKLLRAEISEADVIELRNTTDISAHITAANFVDAAQNPRDMWAAASLSWYHLDMFLLNSLTDDINKIKAEERALWFEVIGLENQIKNEQKQFQTNVNALTEGLSGSTLAEINDILNDMKMLIENDVLILRSTRIQIVDDTNVAVAALQKILNQLPTNRN